MRKPFYLALVFLAAVAGSNLPSMVKADPPTILDYSSVTDNVITVGDSECKIELDMSTHVATVTARKLHVNGIDAGGQQVETLINTQHFAAGDYDSNLYGESFTTDGSTGTAVVNSPGNTQP